jgi:DeoR family fructose operon transcriptional repressor
MKQKFLFWVALATMLVTGRLFAATPYTSLSVLGASLELKDGTTKVGNITIEQDIAEKSRLYNEEKTAIARYAASLLEDGDFVFIDAGTTTEKMIDFIPDLNVTFVTNAFVNAKKLAQRGYKVFLPAGEIKLITEAIVGAECVSSLQNYNFTKCFIGANGISLSAGISTPDRNEASIKSVVIAHSRTAYVLSDHSKFDQIASVTFAKLNQVQIITDRLGDRKYLAAANIREVM